MQGPAGTWSLFFSVGFFLFSVSVAVFLFPFCFSFLSAGRLYLLRYGVREIESPATRGGYVTSTVMTGCWVANKSTEGGLWVKVVAEVREARMDILGLEIGGVGEMGIWGLGLEMGNGGGREFLGLGAALLPSLPTFLPLTSKTPCSTPPLSGLDWHSLLPFFPTHTLSPPPFLALPTLTLS
ncbi:hypothetical protein BDR22DRAFT_844297 [Usnea florida]